MALGTFVHFGFLGQRLGSSGLKPGIKPMLCLLSDSCPGGGENEDNCGIIAKDECPGGGTLKDKCGSTDKDDCPGGNSNTDVCDDDDKDDCPGELPPTDICPANGARDKDACDSGSNKADVCDEATDPKSDQCITGMPDDDKCTNSSKNYKGDICHNGTLPTDECPPKGTDSDGDQCPGGGPDVDTCDPAGSGPANGDECSSGSFTFIPGDGNEDDCTASNPDQCTFSDDDACIEGTNTDDGAGGTDKCVGAKGSDQCTDGSDATDVCSTKSDSYGLFDSCPYEGNDPTGNPIDRCDAVSPDTCLGGENDADVCNQNSVDECPGGGAEKDMCQTVSVNWDSDECVLENGCVGGDQSTGIDKDVCTPNSQGRDSCNIGTPDYTPPKE